MSDSTQPSISGKWWIHGEDKPPHAGVLSTESGRLELEVRIPRGMSEITVYPLLAPQSPVPETVYGCDEQDKPITLFCCRSRNGWSVGEDRYRINTMAAVQRARLSSWQEPVARTVRLRLQNLHRWLDHQVVASETKDGARSFTVPLYEDLIFNVDSQLQVRICRHTTGSSGYDGDHFTPDCAAYLVFSEAKSLDEVTSKWAHWTTHFFSLLVGTSIRCEEIVYWPHDYFEQVGDRDEQIARHENYAIVWGRLTTKHRIRISDPIPHIMYAPFKVVKNQLADMFRRWLDINDRLEPMVTLFSALAFHQRLYVKAQFLLLIQCLEVYHVRSGHYGSNQLHPHEHRRRQKLAVDNAPEEIREWVRQKVRPNYKSLAERLTEIFQHHLAEATLLFCPLVITVDRIKHTRNHLTHYNLNTNSPRYLKRDDIAELNHKMEHFIWVLLLRELAVPEECIKRAMRTAPNAKFMGLPSAFTD